MNKKIETILEFQKIRQTVAEYAHSERGKQFVLALPIRNSIKEVSRQLQETADGVEILRLKQGIPIPRLKDIHMHLKRLEVEATLNARELSEIARVLTTTQEVKHFFQQLEQDGVFLQHVYQKSEELVVLGQVTKLLIHSISEDGYVLDDASATLKKIRAGIIRNERAIREKLDSYLSGSQASQLSDQLITMRNDRYVLPVKAEYRNAFGGIVHDQSSSGQTLFMEPQAVVVLNNRLKELQMEEQLEIERILIELSNEIAPYTSEIEHNHYVLTQFDVINAKALYAHTLKATEPIVDEQNVIELWKARHPLIEKNKVVANDILLGKGYKTMVITGPNTGGKTILIKTLGLIQLMAQAGLFIPCSEGSRVGVFEEIFGDIGDEQSLEQNLSTFSGHLTSIVSILSQLNERSLVLFDEIGSGTDPQEGASLAIAILDYIGSKGSYVLASTHYPELKAYGYRRPETINASMEFDVETLQPTYRLLIGIPGKSNAFDISSRLGLPEEIILQARNQLSQETRDLQDVLTELEDKRHQYEEAMAQMENEIEESARLLADLKEETERFSQQKERLLDEAKEAANRLVEQSKKEAEEIMADIRSLQLRGHQSVVKEHELIEQRSKLDSLVHHRELKKNKVLQKAKAKKTLQAGQTVEVLSLGQRGVLLEKSSATTWVVQMGMLKMKIEQKDIESVEVPEEKKQTVIVKSSASSHVSPELDIRGKRYEDALKDVEQYLDAATLAGYAQVTIIHGRGTGALQQGVHSLLKTHRGIASFAYAPMNLGGAGATIARLK